VKDLNIIRHTFFDDIDIAKRAIGVLRKYEPANGYYLAFSGGKDSCVIKELAIQAEVKFDAHYSVTTIDPPEVVYFIRKFHPDVIFDRPEIPFLTKLISKGFPLRQKRWCCEYLKERCGRERVVVTGIRRTESFARRSREIYETFKGKTNINPILNWSNEEVWLFIKYNNIPYCNLYDLDFSRIGCLFCPMKSPMIRKLERERYPGYEKSFRWAFNKLYENRLSKGKTSILRWKNGDEMFDWWINDYKNKKAGRLRQEELFNPEVVK